MTRSGEPSSGIGEQAVGALAAERDHVAEPATARRIVVGMRDRDLAPDLRAVILVAERLQSLGIEADRQRRLGERDRLAAEEIDVDVAVVGVGRREDRGDALKQRAAWIRREPALRQLPRCFRVAKGARAQEAVAIGDAAVVEAEPVQHGEAVEPVIDGLPGEIEFGRPGAHERARKPARELARDRQGLDARLGIEIGEAHGIGSAVSTSHGAVSPRDRKQSINAGADAPRFEAQARKIDATRAGITRRCPLRSARPSPSRASPVRFPSFCPGRPRRRRSYRAHRRSR